MLFHLFLFDAAIIATRLVAARGVGVWVVASGFPLLPSFRVGLRRNRPKDELLTHSFVFAL
jgi:hypothetical protein